MKLIFVLILLTTLGCASPSMILYRQPFSPQSETANIEVYQTNKPDQEYIEIAKITCGDTDDNYNMRQIIKKAKEVGADAIIILGKSGEYGALIGGIYASEGYGISVIAIKYKD